MILYRMSKCGIKWEHVSIHSKPCANFSYKINSHVHLYVLACSFFLVQKYSIYSRWSSWSSLSLQSGLQCFLSVSIYKLSIDWSMFIIQYLCLVCRSDPLHKASSPSTLKLNQLNPFGTFRWQYMSRTVCKAW